MSGREAVLAKVRRALGGSASQEQRRRAAEARLADPQPNVVPARGQLDPESRVQLFIAMAEKVSATVQRLPGGEDIPSAVAAYLRRHNLPAQIRSGADSQIQALPWDREPNLERRTGASDGSDA
ncbi:MAG TPA: lactate utilization protein, partial [Propylenella sp.]|nr:lactate utilization protein [Propylenella sp.]